MYSFNRSPFIPGTKSTSGGIGSAVWQCFEGLDYLAEQKYVIGEGGSTSLGILYSVVGIGTGVGPILARRVTGDRDQPFQSQIICVVGCLRQNLRSLHWQVRQDQQSHNFA